MALLTSKNVLLYRYLEPATRPLYRKGIASHTSDCDWTNPRSVLDLPGPKPSLPFIGTQWIFSSLSPYRRDKIHEAYEDFYHKYGPIFRETRSGVNIVSIYNPQDVETVFRAQGAQPLRPANEANVHIRRSRPEEYKSVGLVDANGEEWYDIRRKVAPYLLKPTVMSEYMNGLTDVADDLVRLLKSARDEKGSIQDITQYFFRYGLEAICLLIFGKRVGCLEREMSSSAKELIILSRNVFVANVELTLTYPWWKIIPTKSFLLLERSDIQLSKITRQYSKEILSSSNKSDDEHPSILRRFLGVKDFDEKDINTVLQDFIAAGISTTAYSLVLLLHRLGREPEVVQKIQKELDSELQSHNETLTAEVLNSLPFLKATVKEGFRLTPIIPNIMRLPEKDVVLQGFLIPAYTPVLCQTRAACTQGDNFSRPLEFIPERWLPKTYPLDDDYIALRSEAAELKFLVLPFGFGSRQCVGRRMAECEIYTVLAKLLKSFNVRSHGELKLQNYLVLGPKFDAPLILQDR